MSNLIICNRITEIVKRFLHFNKKTQKDKHLKIKKKEDTFTKHKSQ